MVYTISCRPSPASFPSSLFPSHTTLASFLLLWTKLAPASRSFSMHHPQSGMYRLQPPCAGSFSLFSSWAGGRPPLATLFKAAHPNHQLESLICLLIYCLSLLLDFNLHNCKVYSVNERIERSSESKCLSYEHLWTSITTSCSYS